MFYCHLQHFAYLILVDKTKDAELLVEAMQASSSQLIPSVNLSDVQLLERQHETLCSRFQSAKEKVDHSIELCKEVMAKWSPLRRDLEEFICDTGTYIQECTEHINLDEAASWKNSNMEQRLGEMEATMCELRARTKSLLLLPLSKQEKDQGHHLLTDCEQQMKEAAEVLHLVSKAMDPSADNFQRLGLKKVRKVIAVPSYDIENGQTPIQKSYFKHNVLLANADIRQSASGKPAISTDGRSQNCVAFDWEPGKYFPSTDRLEVGTKRKQIDEVSFRSDISSLDEDQLQTDQDRENEKSILSIHSLSGTQSEEMDGYPTLLKDKQSSETSSFKTLLSDDMISLECDSIKIDSFSTAPQSINGNAFDSGKNVNTQDGDLLSFDQLGASLSLSAAAAAAESEFSCIEPHSNSFMFGHERDVLKDFEKTQFDHPKDEITQNAEKVMPRLSFGEKSEEVAEHTPTMQLKEMWNNDNLQKLVEMSDDIELDYGFNEPSGLQSQTYDGQRMTCRQNMVWGRSEVKLFSQDGNKASDWRHPSGNEVGEHSPCLDGQSSSDCDIVPSGFIEEECTALRGELNIYDAESVRSEFVKGVDFGLKQRSAIGDIPVESAGKPSTMSHDIQVHRNAYKSVDTEEIVPMEDEPHTKLEFGDVPKNRDSTGGYRGDNASDHEDIPSGIPDDESLVLDEDSNTSCEVISRRSTVIPKKPGFIDDFDVDDASDHEDVSNEIPGNDSLVMDEDSNTSSCEVISMKTVDVPKNRAVTSGYDGGDASDDEYMLTEILGDDSLVLDEGSDEDSNYSHKVISMKTIGLPKKICLIGDFDGDDASDHEDISTEIPGDDSLFLDEDSNTSCEVISRKTVDVPKKSSFIDDFDGDDASDHKDISSEIPDDDSLVLDYDTNSNHEAISNMTIDLKKQKSFHSGDKEFTDHEALLTEYLDCTHHDSLSRSLPVEDDQQVAEYRDIQTTSSGEASLTTVSNIFEGLGMALDESFKGFSLLSKIQDTSGDFYSDAEGSDIITDEHDAEGLLKILQGDPLLLDHLPPSSQGNMPREADGGGASAEAKSREISGYGNVSVDLVEQSKDFETTEYESLLLATYVQDTKPESENYNSASEEPQEAKEPDICPFPSGDLASFDSGHQTQEDSRVASEKLVILPSLISTADPVWEEGGVSHAFMQGATFSLDDERKGETPNIVLQFEEEQQYGRDIILEDVDGGILSTSGKNRNNMRGSKISEQTVGLPSTDSKEMFPETQKKDFEVVQESWKVGDSEGVPFHSEDVRSEVEPGHVASEELLRDAQSSEKPAEKDAVAAGLRTQQLQAASVVVPYEEHEEQKRIQKLDEEKRLQQLEEKRLREIEAQRQAQRQAQKLEDERRLQELAEQKRLEELEEQRRLQELKQKEQERLQKLREQRQASCQPYQDRLHLCEQKLVNVGRIPSAPEKLEEKKWQLEDLMHELRSLESDLEALKEAQREEWSEISPGDDETDPLGIALSTAEVLKHNVKRSSDTVQELIRDCIQKQEQLSEIEKQIESVRSWHDRAVAVTFEQPVRTSSSRFVKEQLLDATNVSEELEIRVQEIEAIIDQVRGLPEDYAEVKTERNVEGKLEVLNEDIHTLKDNLEERIKNLKQDAEKNEKRQKEVQIMDVNLASVQKKVLFMLKSSSGPLKEDIEVWQDLQKPSKDLQQMLKLHLQEQQELIKTIADQHEVLRSSMPESSRGPPQKFLKYTPLPLSVVTGEPGSSKILETSIQKKITELQEYWKDLELNENATLDDYIGGQMRFDTVISTAFQWLDCIETEASKTTEIQDLQRQANLFRTIHQELFEQLEVSLALGQSLADNLPASGTEQNVMLSQSLEDLDQRLSLLEEEVKLREQLAAEKKIWQKNLDEQLANAQRQVFDSQQKFLGLSDGKIPSETRLTLCHQLNGACRDGLRKLDALRTEVQLRVIQDPLVSVPPDLFLLRHQLNDLDSKVTEKKVDLSRTTNLNSQYETLLEQYVEFLETAHEKVKTSKQSTKDLAQLKDQLSSHRGFFQDLVSHQTLTASLYQKVEPHVKERFNSNHTRLNTLTRAILDKANLNEMQMKQAVDRWSYFESRFSEVVASLENEEQRLRPQRATEKDSIEILERNLLDLQSIKKDLEHGKGSVVQVLENGRQLLKLVSCPSLQRQLDDVADRYKKLDRGLEEELKSLETFVKQLKQFDSEIGLLENWMKLAVKKKDSIDELLSSPNQSPYSVIQAEKMLRELKDEFDDHQNRKAFAVSLGNKLLQCRPAYFRVQSKLNEVNDDWPSLGNDIAAIETKILNAQKMLLPSRQALGELLQYLDSVYRSAAEEDGFSPKNREDVRQLLKKFKSLKGDLANLQMNVDYINKVAEQNSGTGSHADQTLSAEQLGEMNRRYRVLCSDINSKVVNLELISDTWKEFECGVRSLREALSAESVKISAEERNLNGNTVATTLMLCSEFSAAMKQRRENDLRSLSELGSSLTESKDWASDANAIANITNDLNDQCELLDKKVNSLKLSAEKTKSCLEEYSSALDGVNNVLDTTGFSLNNLRQMSGCNSESLKEQVESLKALQRNFHDCSGLIQRLDMATAALMSNCDPGSSPGLQNTKKLAVERWQMMQNQISEKLSSLEALSLKWNSYDQQYNNALEWLHMKESEVDQLLKDGSQIGKEENLKQKQRDLNGFGDRILELDALSKEIMPSLDGGQVVHMVSEQMMLSELARNLHQVVERQLEILDLAENHQEKFTEQCGEVERFLKETESIVSEVSLPYDASDYRIVNDRLGTAKGLTGRFVEMNSRFQELGHSGYRLPLSMAESSRLKGISDRWHGLHSRSKALEKKFQQQSLLLQSFSDKCEEWNKFLADEEKVLSADLVGDYVSLANQQQLLEKFQDEIYPRQQILYSIIGDGHKMIENGQGDMADFGRKLQLLEEQWQTVVRQANQRKAIVDNIVTVWQAYRTLHEQLSSDVRDVRQFIDGHPVSAGSFSTLKHLLDEYTENQNKLATMEPTVEKLRSYVQLLSPNSEPTTVKQIDLDTRAMDEEIKNLDATVSSNINQLQNVIQLWDATRLKMENFLIWLKETKKYIAPDVPTEYEALIDELRSLEDLQSDKGSRCDDVTKDLGQLTQVISPEDSKMICQRLRLLTQHHSEVSNQISARCETVKDRLGRWKEFDRNVDDLMAEFALLDDKIRRLDVLSIEDSIATVQNALRPELEILKSKKRKLIQDGKELRQDNRDLRAADIDNRMSRIRDRYAQLEENLITSLNKLTVALGTLQELESSLKKLRHWLLSTEHLLTNPVVYETSDPTEIQNQLRSQENHQKKINDHSTPVSSVLGLCDNLSSDSIACPTPVESQSLDRAKSKLESRWRKINDLSAQRKHLIEETGKLWQKFSTAHQSFSLWLRSMERRVTTPKTQNMSFSVMKTELKETQKLQGVIQTNLSELDSLNRLYCHLAHEGRTDSKKTLKRKIDDANRRWDDLLAKADAVAKHLGRIIGVKDDFDTYCQALTNWLSCYNDALIELEELDGSPSTDVVNFIKKELGSCSNKVDYIDRAAKFLTAKCKPSDALRIQHDVDKFHRLRLEVLRRLTLLDCRLPSNVEDELTRHRMRKLESKLAKYGKKDALELEAALGRLDAEDVGLDSLLRNCLDRDNYNDVETARPYSADDESALLVELTGLEKWFVEADAVLSSGQELPQVMIQYDQSLKKHQNLAGQIRNWAPTALWIRSAHAQMARGSLRDRVSRAVDKWEDVCQRSSDWFERLRLALVQSEEFHLNVEDLTVWINDVREEVSALDCEKTVDGEKILAIENDLTDIGLELEFLRNIGDYLLKNSTSPSANIDFNQLDKLTDDLEQLRVAYGYKKSFLDKTVRKLPENCLLGSKIYADSFAPSLLGIGKRRLPRHANLRKLGESTPEGGARTASGEEHRSCRGVLRRACRAAIPIQIMLLILIGAASLVPFCESDCAMNSLNLVVKFPDGGSPPL